MPGADASRPAAGSKSRNIQIFLRFYALPAGGRNTQNHQFIISRALRSRTTGSLVGVQPDAAAKTVACRPAPNGLIHERLTQFKTQHTGRRNRPSNAPASFSVPRPGFLNPCGYCPIRGPDTDQRIRNPRLVKQWIAAEKSFSFSDEHALGGLRGFILDCGRRSC